MQVRWAVLTARIVFAAGCVLAAYECLVFARASSLYEQDTASSIPAALALVPFNGAYASRLAAWQPERKEELLNRAVALNPFDVDSWIQLGLTAELQNGDPQAAERYYLRAADIDKMFRPRWTLTNFYFRQRRPSEFFRWARATLEITPYQTSPVFAQMWLMSQDAAKIAGFVPNRPSILVQYAIYLATEKQFSAVPPIVQRLSAHVNARDAHAYGRDDVIGPMQDKMLMAADVDAALKISATLHTARWLPYAPPSRENPLTNGDFRQPVFGHGFDWAIVNTAGVSASQDQNAGSLTFLFTGDEAERTPLLRQFIPIRSERSYRLAWRAEGDGMSFPSGLEWHIYPLQKNAPDTMPSVDLLSSAYWDFTTGTHADAAMLVLEYARPLGSTLATGSITLRTVSLKEKDDLHEKD